MSYTIIKHPLVELDIFDITDFISSYAGTAIGKSKVDEITLFISRLTDFPQIGTIQDDILPGLRAIPASEKAVVCFTVNDENLTVSILCVSYAGSDWASRVKERA
ncbi:Plasmid stabilization system protein [Neorhizobium galegae bv. orientalis]|nr:Plasmid stabilization system protein [Neorhizobium galegae bv. orientalis]